MTVTETPITSQLTMVQLLRRNATVFQLVFALLWSLRFVAAVGEPEAFSVVAITALVGLLAVRTAWRAVNGPRARDVFRSPEGRLFLRPVTRLTLWQIAASLVLPGLATLVDATEWTIPIVAATIGLFFVGFGRSLHISSVSLIGCVATAGSLLLRLLAEKETLLVLVALLMVASLLASAWCCAMATTTVTASNKGSVSADTLTGQVPAENV